MTVEIPTESHRERELEMTHEMRDPQSELVWQGAHGRTAHRAARALPGSRSPAPGTMPRPAGSTPPSFDLK